MLGAFKGAKSTPAPTPSSECDITAYSLPVGVAGADVSGVITDTAIAVAAESGTTVTALKATFTVSEGATVKVGDVEQTSGTTENDFTNPVSYVVTAEDGTIKYITADATNVGSEDSISKERKEKIEKENSGTR